MRKCGIDRRNRSATPSDLELLGGEREREREREREGETTARWAISVNETATLD